MDLNLENLARNVQFDISEPQNALPYWSCNSSSSIARDEFPQEIWLDLGQLATLLRVELDGAGHPGGN